IVGIDHMCEAIGEAGIENDFKPARRIGDAVAHLIARRRLHPAVRRENPESGERGADGDGDRGKYVEPAWYAVTAEEEDAEECRLEKESREHLIADKRAKHVAGDRGEAAPVGAELIRHHDARDDAHGEGHGEDPGPQARDIFVNVAAALGPYYFQRGDISR